MCLYTLYSCRSALAQFCNHAFEFRPLNPDRLIHIPNEMNVLMRSYTQPNIYRRTEKIRRVGKRNLPDFPPLYPAYTEKIFRVNFPKCRGGGGSTKKFSLLSKFYMTTVTYFCGFQILYCTCILFILILKLFLPIQFARITFVIP